MEFPTPGTPRDSDDAQEARAPEESDSQPVVTATPVPEPAAAPRPPVSPPVRRPRKRRVVLPFFLFIATCLSTFWAGAARELAPRLLQGGASMAQVIAYDFPAPLYDGLKYMAAVMGILLAHEMGHFIFTLRHRIPASFPMFVPFPVSPFGTMGAVIAMHGSQADRRQMFDIGIAGPLAGLLIAIPVTCWGIMVAEPGQNMLTYHHPLAVQLMIHVLRPELAGENLVMNPMLMAGWVGLLVTGLNMLPMSQLDGGHISYALLRKKAHTLARLFLLTAVLFSLGMMYFTGTSTWIVMIILIALIGVDHPPTANDQAPLGRFRLGLGYLSLLIPVFCFPPLGISA